jgi:hypothetical protein
LFLSSSSPFYSETERKEEMVVPVNYEQAVQLDEENGNTLWQDSACKEMKQVMEYSMPGEIETETKDGYLVFGINND